MCERARPYVGGLISSMFVFAQHELPGPCCVVGGKWPFGMVASRRCHQMAVHERGRSTYAALISSLAALCTLPVPGAPSRLLLTSICRATLGMATPTHSGDEERLARLGYKQEFKRHFTPLEVWGLSFSIIGIFPSIASVVLYS